ncbi:uncharacterized protein LOC127250136 [Andrographis paniculata]|uniref:uncharacterized protein LOC127250136 n=1 Tax=Andrographis paniculata TaxID=175694 RepID=UPI0021E82B2C|nr:uncharacterized protein LOC127250136 [Andrographis paniculata]
MVQRKPRILEETAKTAMSLTPNSSEKSTSTTTEGSQSENRETAYFPGCRRDANCNCEICIASINATLDLIPQSVHGSSRTVNSRPNFPRSPVSFPSPADLLTPKSAARMRRVDQSPLSNSIGAPNLKKNPVGKGGFSSRVYIVSFILGIILFCCVYGLPRKSPRVLKAQFPPNFVQNFGEKLGEIEELNAKFMFLKNELESFVGNKVSSCSSDDSQWKINQNRLLLHSKCVLYKSMVEEVSIWGWPLPAAGVLTTEGSVRTLLILSGSISEWISPKANYLVRKSNSTWAQRKWSSTVVQMESNTWILDYRRSLLVDSAAGVVELAKSWPGKIVEKVVQGFLTMAEMRHYRRRHHHCDFITGGCVAAPT